MARRLLMLLRFRLRLIRLALRMAPIAGAAGEEQETETEIETEETTETEGDSEETEAETEETETAAEDRTEPNWKQASRKHEREAKKARKERDDLAAKLKKREDADKSEQEKAIEEAGRKAREELESKFDKERRNDRLEVAATKLAAKGLKIGSGDDAKTVKFADPDDALLHLERDIRNGDLDPEDVFDENGKVNSDQLQEALVDLLSRKPHLAAEGKPGKVAGGADGGKGQAATTDTSVEDQLSKIRRHKDGAQQQHPGARSYQAA